MYNLVKSYVVKDSIQTISKTHYWTPQSLKRLLRIEKQTILVFVKFGEKLCSKRYDTNDLKTRYLNFSKREKIGMNRT